LLRIIFYGISQVLKLINGFLQSQSFELQNNVLFDKRLLAAQRYKNICPSVRTCAPPKQFKISQDITLHMHRVSEKKLNLSYCIAEYWSNFALSMGETSLFNALVCIEPFNSGLRNKASKN